MTTSHLERLAGIEDEFILSVAGQKAGVVAADELFGVEKTVSVKMDVLPSWLIMPPQTRKQYAVKPLAELADTMEDLTQINPISIGMFTDQDRLKSYITELNSRFDCDMRIGEAPFLPIMHEEHGDVYLVVIAGNRRTLGNLANNAAQSLRGGGALDFDLNSVEVRAWLNPDFLLAMKLQVAENAGRENVQPWEEAESTSYVFLNETHGQSREAFAKSCGISIGTFRNHLRYMELPLTVRRLVDGSDPWLENEARLQKVDSLPLVPYEIAVKLWPMLDSKLFSADELTILATDFIRKRLTKKEMEFAISEALSYRRLPASSQLKLIEEQVPTSYWTEFAKFFIEFPDEAALNVFINDCVMQKWTINHLKSMVEKRVNEKKTYGNNSTFGDVSAEFAMAVAPSVVRVGVEKDRVRSVAQELLRLVTMLQNGGPSAAAVIEGIGHNADDLKTVTDALSALDNMTLEGVAQDNAGGLVLGIRELLAYVSRERDAARLVIEQAMQAEVPKVDDAPSLFG